MLHRSIKTVETYRSRIKDKLGMRTGAELIQYAFRYLSSDQAVRPGLILPVPTIGAYA
jgi:hypothetical protein